jgi:hypothetical protein
MRLWVIFLAGAPLALGQPFSFGVKGGVPPTDFLSATNSGGLGYFTTTNRYIVGPEAELRLPFGFGVEFDALYRHLNYTNFRNSIDVLLDSSNHVRCLGNSPCWLSTASRQKSGSSPKSVMAVEAL